MDSKHPGKKKREMQEAFGELRNSLHDFFHKRPVKGFLQSMDEFFQLPFATFPVHIREKDDQQIIIAELPGVKKEQISIEILKDSIRISVKNNEMLTEVNEETNYYKKSESFQQMSRTIYLGFPIDEKKVKASYKDGLLKVLVPKLKGKRIQINEEIEPF